MKHKLLTTRNALLAVLSVLLALCLAFGIFMLPDRANAEEQRASVAKTGASVWDGNLAKAGWGVEHTEPVKGIPVPSDGSEVDANDNSLWTKPNGYSVTKETAEGKITVKTVTIDNAEAFAFFAREIYEFSENYEGCKVTLTTDIDLQGKLWIPIGWSTRMNGADGSIFWGEFDGGNHTVSGLSTSEFNKELTVSGEKLSVKSIEVPADIIEYTGKDADGEKIALYNYGLFGSTGNATIKNLTVDNIDVTVADKTVGKLTIKAEGTGSLIGMSFGHLTVNNCTVGSENGTDKVERTTTSDVVGNGYPISLGGMVGIAWAGVKDGKPFGELSNTNKSDWKDSDSYFINGYEWGNLYFENCVSYVNIIEKEKAAKDGSWHQSSGILGHMQDDSKVTFVNCINYGDIDAPNASAAGMTGDVARWTTGDVKGNKNSGTVEKVENVVSITNCANYGNLKGTGNATGGLLGKWESYWADDAYVSYRLEINCCENYGNIESGDGVGGIVGYVFMDTNCNHIIEITDCFNYGDITATDGEKETGGIVGSLSSNETTVESGRNITISGGNSGKVTVTSTNRTGCVNSPIRPVWNVLYLIDAYRVYEYTASNIEGTATAELIYADAAKKIVSGVKVNGEGNYTVTIPEGVEEIADAAFVGQKGLTAVTFAGNKLQKIGKWAFAGTSIAEAKIPASVEVIGAAAFGECGNLAKVTVAKDSALKTVGQAAFGNCMKLNAFEVPENPVGVEFGKYAFNGTRAGTTGNAQGAFVIAKNSEQFNKICDNIGEMPVNGILTYPVTVEYDYLGTVIDTETRLYNQKYELQLVNGVWTEVQDTVIGTSKTGNARWYSTGDPATSTLLDTLDKVTAKLAEVKGDVLTLYTYETDKKVFIAREGLVYDGRHYSMTELNSLLAASSDYITSYMTASIVNYTDMKGNQTTAIDVCNAGEYEMKVTEGVGDAMQEYFFTINIAPATLNLGDYNNLSWQLSYIGTAEANTELLNGNGLTLYIYKDNNNNEYPSTTVLSAEQISALNLQKTYTTRTVLYSAVRNRNAEVTIGIKPNGAYSLSDVENVTGKAVGKYGAQVTLTADNNYTFTVSGINSMRGLTIETDGNTATVTKDWYIVDLSNWLTTADGADYSISGHVYGANVNYVAPALYYNDKDSNSVSMTLYLDNNEIGSFDISDFSKYVNRVMPAGEYRLDVVVDSVISLEPNGHGGEDEIFHGGFTETIRFTVEKAQLPSLAELDKALKDKTFKYEWEENTSHLYDADAAAVVNAYLQDNVANLSREGTIWADYAEYYSDFTILYNLARMQSDEYFAANDTKVATADADKYTVYYQIFAKNYYSSIENLAGGTRQDYRFYVINIREIELPVVLKKDYNGEVQVADIADGLYYTVTANDGGTNAGTYTVELTFRNPDYYMWAGQTIDNRTSSITLNFEIAKANNSWTQSLGITTWTVGKYGELELEEGEFVVKAQAKYGNVVIRLVNADDPDTVIYESANGTEELDKILAGLGVGSYMLTASVAESGDLFLLTDTILFRVFPQEGLPWWAVLLIVVGALGVVAIVLLILHEKGVLQMLTGKFVIAMRTKMTVDATIAAVRANMVAENSKKSIAEAEARDRVEAFKKAREEGDTTSAEEHTEVLEEKAQAAAKKAEDLQKRVDKLKQQTANIRENAQTDEKPESDEQ